MHQGGAVNAQKLVWIEARLKFGNGLIDSVPMAQEGVAAAPARQVFRGWMFANAPGLHLFQNPAYDAWAIACKTASPAA